MDEPIEETYFNWLCAKVLSVQVPIYWHLMRILHNTEFVWVVSRDRNRAEEGLELREDFLRELYLDPEEDWANEPCSVLEMLIGFAKRAAFQTERTAKSWFWEFMTNLGLDEYRQVSNADVPIIEDILYTFIWRTYDDNGHGGMFPMRWPKRNQAGVEIWYQFCEYLDENE